MEIGSFKIMAIKVLEEEGRPLTGDEIWKAAKAKGYDKLHGSQGRTPWKALLSRIYVDIRRTKSTPFVKVSTHPTRFYLRRLLPEEQPTSSELTFPLTVSATGTPEPNGN